MRKTPKKLTLHRETLQILATADIRRALGGTASETVSVQFTACPQCWIDLPPTYSCDLC